MGIVKGIGLFASSVAMSCAFGSHAAYSENTLPVGRGKIEVIKDDKKGVLIVQNSLYRYVFRIKDNLLLEVSKSPFQSNFIADVKGGGGHWIYVTGSGSKADPQKIYRQGEARSKASYHIVDIKEDQAVIDFCTVIGDIEFKEIYAFSTNSSTVKRTYRVTALNDIPNLTLISWQVKLGKDGGRAGNSPYDTFTWGSGAVCIIRNETRLKTAGKTRALIMPVKVRSPWIRTYWLNPEELKEQFVALFNSVNQESWILAFSKTKLHPRYFFGNQHKDSDYSIWFGFRTFGGTIYSNEMPVSKIEKGQNWSNTFCQILMPAKDRIDILNAYNKLN